MNPHIIAVVAFDGVVPFDLATPCEVFPRTRVRDGCPGYEVRICAARGRADAGLFELRTPWTLDEVRAADTVIVPGLSDISAGVSRPVIHALQAASENGARMVSICTGTFVLAAAGLLDGMAATTHWAAAATLAERYPSIRVDPNVLYVDSGRILTSAGAAAGLDLCLHIIRLDHGAAVASAAARLSVVPLERAGGQAQFIVHDDARPDGSLQPVLRWMEANLAKPLTLDSIAARAKVSTRTVNRRFQEQLRCSPLRWLLLARVRRAQALLEATPLPVDVVGVRVGFGSATNFREQFANVVHVTPQAYRSSFRKT